VTRLHGRNATSALTRSNAVRSLRSTPRSLHPAAGPDAQFTLPDMIPKGIERITTSNGTHTYGLIRQD
jgi:hypothetical protein